MEIIGLTIGYVLWLIYRDNKQFRREEKAAKERYEMLLDPEYSVEVSRHDFGREIWLYNKFGEHYATILGEGWEYDLEREQRHKKWMDALSEIRQYENFFKS